MSERASVVIPAHDEEAVLPRLLGALTEGASPGEFRVCVACNGCTDRSAEVARSFPGVVVVEVEEASKSAGLNAGDAAAGDVFPRLYLDADIAVSVDTLREVVAALEVDEPRAASPRLDVALEGRPPLVRGFYRVFLGLPWATDSPLGSGFYALSAAGRARFGAFPAITNDDELVRSLFAEDERITVDGTFTIQAPYTTRALMRAKARVATGVSELAAAAPEALPAARRQPVRKPGGSLKFVRLARQTPRNWPPLMAYAIVRVGARAIGYANRLRGRTQGWGQDRTTRGGA